MRKEGQGEGARGRRGEEAILKRAEETRREPLILRGEDRRAVEVPLGPELLGLLSPFHLSQPPEALVGESKEGSQALRLGRAWLRDEGEILSQR